MATAKEKVWLEEFYKCWNATEAARRADYKHPNVMGPRKKAKFADEIKTHLAEKAMDADEVLARLGDQARGTAENYLRIEDGFVFIDMQKMKDDNKLHLVKKFKRIPTEKGEREEVELYDAQAALNLIGKHHGLFTERYRHEHSGKIELEYIGDWRNEEED